MADEHSSLIGWVIAGGGGTVIGSLIVTVIQTFGRHGRDRGEAADLATNAASRIIVRLEEENTRMRTAIITISEVLDVLVADSDLTEEQRDQLRKALREAKMAAV